MNSLMSVVSLLICCFIVPLVSYSLSLRTELLMFPSLRWLNVHWVFSAVSPIFNLLPSASSDHQMMVPDQNVNLCPFLHCHLKQPKQSWLDGKNHGFSPLSQKNWSCTRKDLEDTEQGLALRILQNCLLYSGHRFAVFTIRRTYSHFHMGMWQPSVKRLLTILMQKRPELFQIFVREQAVHAVRSQTILR